MKAQLLVVVLLLALFFSPSRGQDLAQDPRAHAARPSSTEPSEAHPIAFSGKVSVEGGADIVKDVIVVLDCGFGDRARTNVDPKGNFTLMLNDTGRSSGSSWEQRGANTEWTGCALRAEAPGYVSRTINLEEHQSGMIQVGTIVMSPAGSQGSQGFTVSVASLAAPENAKKNFAKGQDQAKKGRWAAACENFRKAVQVYPRYAIAWLELGRAQLHQNDFVGAQQSFQSAATQDSKLLPAYIELARLQAGQQQWKALAATTANIVQLAPESSAVYWFLDSAANYNLQNLQRANSSAERGLRLDPAHRVPQLEYLYALILGTKQNYALAAQHLQNYLRMSPHADDLRDASARLAEFERLASPQSAQGSH